MPWLLRGKTCCSPLVALVPHAREVAEIDEDENKAAAGEGVAGVVVEVVAPALRSKVARKREGEETLPPPPKAEGIREGDINRE